MQDLFLTHGVRLPRKKAEHQLHPDAEVLVEVVSASAVAEGKEVVGVTRFDEESPEFFVRETLVEEAVGQVAPVADEFLGAVEAGVVAEARLRQVDASAEAVLPEAGEHRALEDLAALSGRVLHQKRHNVQIVEGVDD